MVNTTFRFELGDFDCLVISDGFITVPPGVTMEVLCLLVGTGKQKI